jgi:uncharacterized protein (TIGR02145 family)|tara:strand:- start:932 stop:2296 length:1365 start_codon:yes stop_codon:yes gene_type:complete
MKNLLLTLALGIFFMPFGMAQSTTLNDFISNNPDIDHFHSIGNHHYFIKDALMTWTDAKNYGDEIGVSMYIINDSNEENEVYSNLPLNSNTSVRYWIGLYQDTNDPNYAEPGGGWKWVDGTILAYSNWLPNEPNNENEEDYAHIDNQNGTGWNDISNSQDYAIIKPIYEFVSSSSAPGILLNGTVSVQNNQIKNLQDPTDAKDAVTFGILLSKITALQDQIDALQAATDSGSVSDQNGNRYPYLTYGDQEWTVINGAMETYRDGTEIPQVSDATQWENLTTGAWCYYGNDPSKGKLYNWYALVGIHDAASLSDASLRKEFAPEGWHVPTDTEWTTLQNYLIANGYNYDGSTTEIANGYDNKIGKAMASASGWTSFESAGAIGNSNPNNSSGFNALPGGSILGTFFSGYGSEARFWTLTYFGNNLYHKRMDYRFSGIGTHNEGATLGCSVRFVRN